MRRHIKGSALALLAAALLGGCASEPEKKTEPDVFGSSVRHMIRAQTFNPLAGQTAGEAPSGMDGQRAGAAIEGYRGGKPVNTREGGEREQRVWTQSTDAK